MTENSKPVLRFAPSPDGIPAYRRRAYAALFNWLYAHHSGGKYLLRIEDTDLANVRPLKPWPPSSTCLTWLGAWPGMENRSFRKLFARADRHREIARDLLARNIAYRCYATPQELEQMRAEQKAKGLSVRYDGRWRDRKPGPEQSGMPYVIRLKAPQTGETVIDDRVSERDGPLGERAAGRHGSAGAATGTPTYMLAVVVDDYDMGITHVIRGADHLNNAARQVQIIRAMGWPEPVYAHVPLIHGPDGAKLSKRHGALAVEAYRDMGYLPEAMRNYLLRLCWSHGDDEIIPTEKAIDWFDLTGIGRSAARFDLKKLESLNAHYMRETCRTEHSPMRRLPFAERLTAGPHVSIRLPARGSLPQCRCSRHARKRWLSCWINLNFFSCRGRRRWTLPHPLF